MYIFGTSTSGVWLLVNQGIKLAIDAGAHRKSTYGKEIDATKEMWKRAFWYVLEILYYHSNTF